MLTARPSDREPDTIPYLYKERCPDIVALREPLADLLHTIHLLLHPMKVRIEGNPFMVNRWSNLPLNCGSLPVALT